jgi:hypothetical protein
MPIVLGIIIPFWGILLSAPLLAILYAYRAQNQKLLAAREANSVQVPEDRA